jgi:hypothetical protein
MDMFTSLFVFFIFTPLNYVLDRITGRKDTIQRTYNSLLNRKQQLDKKRVEIVQYGAQKRDEVMQKGAEVVRGVSSMSVDEIRQKAQNTGDEIRRRTGQTIQQATQPLQQAGNALYDKAVHLEESVANRAATEYDQRTPEWLKKEIAARGQQMRDAKESALTGANAMREQVYKQAAEVTRLVYAIVGTTVMLFVGILRKPADWMGKKFQSTTAGYYKSTHRAYGMPREARVVN